jgi:hypothetical protein
MGLTRIRAQQISDLDYKQACRVVATDNITLEGGAPAVVDGVSLQQLDRVLVTGQNTASQNGFYRVQTLGQGENGTWVRTSDTDETGELAPGTVVMVTEGEVHADTQWKLTTNGTIVVGETALNFVLNAVSVIGGQNTQVQYNAGGVLAGSANLTFANDELTVVGRANVVGNIATGNILTDGYYYANGEPFVASSNYGDANVATFLDTGFGSNSISTTGNITAAYFVGNGSQLTGITGGGGDPVNFENISSNVLPAANVTYDLGSSDRRWRDLWLSNATIHIGEASISATAGNLELPTTVQIGNAALTESGGSLDLPAGTTVSNNPIAGLGKAIALSMVFGR